MNNKAKTGFKRAQIHPHSIRAVKKGHPWLTKDQFSEKFPKNVSFILGADAKNKDVALFINDPSHPSIKARLWSTKTPLEDQFYNFKHELGKRISNSINSRDLSSLLSERQNIYLVFGEIDYLPGLLVLLLGEKILIQSYTKFWDKYKNDIIKFIKSNLKPMVIKSVHYQNRTINRKSSDKSFDKEFIINEYGINYNVNISNYDIGLYTDMSDIRKKIIPYYKKSKSMVNFFSYTGSFSLLGLEHGIKEVISVDVSNTYNKWLLKNLEINPQLNSSLHTVLKDTASNAVNCLIKQEKTFDLIICDPPSFSQSEDKKQNSFKGYDHLLPKLEKIINTDGHLILFINTHKINRNKFEKKIIEILKKNNLTKSLQIIKSLKLGEDCPTTPAFPEGDYLKGFILKKK